MNDNLRNDMQVNAVRTLAKDRRLILEWGTGVGKSRVAILACAAIFAKNPDARILLAVQETAHKSNWKAEFEEALGLLQGTATYEALTVECYASLPKYQNTAWDLLIADEGHHLRGDNKIAILETITADRILFLSATISDRGDGKAMLEMLNRRFGTFTTLSYGITEAIDDAILAEPEVHAVAVTMSAARRAKYEKLTEYMNSCKREYLQQCGWLGITPEQGEKDPRAQAQRQRWMMAANIRKKFTGAGKTEAAKGLIRKLEGEGRRFICFCANVKQVEALGGTNYVCAERTKKENDAVIARFNSGEAGCIFAVGMIREGQNLEGIQDGIVVQLDGKARSFKQMFGRVMRNRKDPKLYILYVPDSQDEKYLANALSDTDQKYIKGWTKPTLDLRPAPAEKAVRLDLEISRERIFCHSLGPDAYGRRDMCYLQLQGGELRGTSAGRPVRGTHLTGTLVGVFYNGRTGNFEMILRAGTSYYMVQEFWRRCYGMLLPLASGGCTRDTLLTITTRPNGQYTDITYSAAGRQLPWPRIDLPQDDGGRINLLNNLVAAINRAA